MIWPTKRFYLQPNRPSKQPADVGQCLQHSVGRLVGSSADTGYLKKCRQVATVLARKSPHWTDHPKEITIYKSPFPAVLQPGWWLSHPEKYEFVSWDYYSQNMEK